MGVNTTSVEIHVKKFDICGECTIHRMCRKHAAPPIWLGSCIFSLRKKENVRNSVFKAAESDMRY